MASTTGFFIYVESFLVFYTGFYSSFCTTFWAGFSAAADGIFFIDYVFVGELLSGYL